MFGYVCANGRCAVDLDQLRWSAGEAGPEAVLAGLGFLPVSVDAVALARSLIGTSGYRRGARPGDAPVTVDCSSLVKWAYAQRGIWLPRRSIQQRRMGRPVVTEQLGAGDLVFTVGCTDYYEDDPSDGVGHVALATGEGTVVHAVNSRRGVVESPLAPLTEAGVFRGACRIVPAGHRVRTYVIPPELDVETSDDVRWLVLQCLHRSR